jgi:hypothetical protein
LNDTRALRAWGSLCGLLFVVLFVVGNALIFDGPNGNESPAKYASFFGDSGNRTQIHIGWILAGLGVFFFLWFVAAMRETIRDLEIRDDAGSGGMLAFLVAMGGTAYAAVTLGALGLADGVRTMSDDTYRHQVYSGVLHANGDGTYIMHATGTAALAAMILAFSLAVLSSRTLPRWLGWFGIVAGLAALASVIFFTMIIWLVWIAATSVLLFLHGRTSARSPATTQPTTA